VREIEVEVEIEMEDLFLRKVFGFGCYLVWRVENCERD